MTIRYTIETIRSGQPYAYADTIREYVIRGEEIFSSPPPSVRKPYLPFGDVEAQIRRDTAMRERGEMSGGYSLDQLRAAQRREVLKLVRGLCGDFRERGDEDGRTGMEAHFYPTLQSLVIDGKAGTIRVVIVEPFTD